MHPTPDTAAARLDLTGFDLFRYFRARANGLSEEEALATIRAMRAEPEREATRLFDVAWHEAPEARAKTVAVVARWFERHGGQGRFFVDDDGICAEVRAAIAERFVVGVMAIAEELDAHWAVAFVEDSGDTSCMAFGESGTRRRTTRLPSDRWDPNETSASPCAS